MDSKEFMNANERDRRGPSTGEPLPVRPESAGYVPRSLDERDTLRLIVLGIKHMDRAHHDWNELLTLVDKFDQSNRGT